MKAVDLLAGAGGFTAGALKAGCEVVWAANHSQQAVDWHARNHPEVEHVCQDLHKADHYREYEKQRANLPHRVEARRRYQKTEGGKKARRKASRRYVERNQSKRAAHVITGNAIRDGRLEKRPCEVCGAKHVHAYHDDYAKPLEVRWLFPKHHQEWHDRHGEGKNAD